MGMLTRQGWNCPLLGCSSPKEPNGLRLPGCPPMIHWLRKYLPPPPVFRMSFARLVQSRLSQCKLPKLASVVRQPE